MTVGVTQLLFLWLRSVLSSSNILQGQGRTKPGLSKGHFFLQRGGAPTGESTCKSGQALLLVFSLPGGHFHCIFFTSF